MTTPAQTDYPVACYEYMGSRSLKRLREMLCDTFRCEALATDGYAAYDSLIAQSFGLNGKAVRQSCLTHLRRRLCQAIGAEALKQQAEAFADDELAFVNLESLKAGDPDRELMAAVVILGAVYAVEQQNAREPDETEADWLVRLAKARKEKSTVLMDDLDRIMLKLSSGRIEPTASGKSWRSVRKARL
nr:transposase [Sutterella wadsworthensis]